MILLMLAIGKNLSCSRTAPSSATALSSTAPVAIERRFVRGTDDGVNVRTLQRCTEESALLAREFDFTFTSSLFGAKEKQLRFPFATYTTKMSDVGFNGASRQNVAT